MASSSPPGGCLGTAPSAASTEADGELTTVCVSMSSWVPRGKGSAANGICWSDPSATTSRRGVVSASATGPSTIVESARAGPRASSTASGSLQRRTTAVTARSMRRRPGRTAERMPLRETTQTKLCRSPTRYSTRVVEPSSTRS